MGPEMRSVKEVSHLLAAGKSLLLAGDEELLRALPAGNWIGGTTSSFLSGGMGISTHEQLFVTELPDFAGAIDIRSYDEKSIAQVYCDAPDNGFSFIIIPYRCRTHLTFGMHAPGFENFALRPLVGWISCTSRRDDPESAPLAFDGREPRQQREGAMVMHVSLPPGKAADIGMINPFEQGDGDRIRFPATGFSTSDAYINGVKTDFAAYLCEKKLDLRLPLVADHSGVMLNTTFRGEPRPGSKVHFYNAVFDFLEYRHAQPIADYRDHFTRRLFGGHGVQTLFACNCVLNYTLSHMEGRRIDCPPGPITFGEIAYQTLNQTLVYLRIIDLLKPATS